MRDAKTSKGFCKKGNLTLGTLLPRVFLFMDKYKIIVLLLAALIIAAPNITHSSMSQEKMRIISLSPAITEILFSLGAGFEVIGVSQFCDYPMETRSIEKVGTFSSPNIEKIVSLRPDVVFTAGLEQAPVFLKLKSLNINAVRYDPSTMNELFAVIIDIGKYINKEKEAGLMVGKMKKELQEIKTGTEKRRQSERPKVFMEIWPSPLTTIGGRSFINEIITLAGGQNIASDVNRLYCRYSPEMVISKNPDVIILAYMSSKSDHNAILKRTGWENIRAVKNNAVYDDITPSLFLRQGPRIIQGIKEIHERIDRTIEQKNR